jgi:hypothetical protein
MIKLLLLMTVQLMLIKKVLVNLKIFLMRDKQLMQKIKLPMIIGQILLIKNGKPINSNYK